MSWPPVDDYGISLFYQTEQCARRPSTAVDRDLDRRGRARVAFLPALVRGAAVRRRDLEVGVKCGVKCGADRPVKLNTSEAIPRLG